MSFSMYGYGRYNLGFGIQPGQKRGIGGRTLVTNVRKRKPRVHLDEALTANNQTNETKENKDA